MSCAVADIGKTSMRLTVLQEDGAVQRSVRRPTPPVLTGAYDALDIEFVLEWLLTALAEVGRAGEIADIIVVTHGAAVARVDGDGRLVAPVMDYEWDVASAAPSYEGERPRFEETGSPSLPAGLNLGRQLAYLDQSYGSEDMYLPLPQYLALRLCGEYASECSSLGCHTDLWAPARADWSSLARGRGWDRRFPPLRAAQEVLGTLTAGAASATGLSRSVRVRCGGHDSNAALVPFLGQESQAVLSTGTWFVAMAPGADAGDLDGTRDTLVGSDVHGEPVPMSRFMGGREHALAAGGEAPSPTLEAMEAVLTKKLFVEPNLTMSGGPVPGRRGRIPASFDSREERSAAASLYTALMADTCISLLPPTRRLAIEGPAATPLFCELLAALRPATMVERFAGGGATYGAASLVLSNLPALRGQLIPAPRHASDIQAYAEEWRERAAQ